MANKAFGYVLRGQRPAQVCDLARVHSYRDPLTVDKRSIAIENDEFYALHSVLQGRENIRVATADVNVSLSADVRTDEEQDLLLDETAELRDAIAALPGIDGVRLEPDPSDPGRQGGELIHLALELIPVALESLLVLVNSWRERRRAKAEAAKKPVAEALPGLAISVSIKTAAGEVTLHVDGSQERALPTVQDLLAQLTGQLPAAEKVQDAKAVPEIAAAPDA